MVHLQPLLCKLEMTVGLLPSPMLCPLNCSVRVFKAGHYLRLWAKICWNRETFTFASS